MWLLCLRFYLTSIAEPQGQCTWCTVKSLAPITIITNMFTCPLEFLNDVCGTTCLTKHTRNRFLCRQAQQVVDLFFSYFFRVELTYMCCLFVNFMVQSTMPKEIEKRFVVVNSFHVFCFACETLIKGIDNNQEQSYDLSSTFTHYTFASDQS